MTQLKLTVVSQQGEEAVIAILEGGAFLENPALPGRRFERRRRLPWKTPIVRIDKEDMIRVLHEEPAFAEVFMAYLLAHTIRMEEDLVDHCLTPARSDSHERCSCWRISEKKRSRKRSLRISVKQHWRR